MKMFSEMLTSYPREIISIVSSDFLHNMEMDGMVMISNKVFDFYDNTPLNNLTILTPHELSHQWFYSLVGNNSAEEPWLDESLATYSEVLFYERYYPEDVTWWWTNRVDEYGPSGYVNSDIYLAGGYNAYRNAVYLNGARFLQELRVAVGDQAFFAALKDYAMTNFYGIATRQDFFDAFGRYSQADIAPILGRYFK
jgi:aminopeptidase N